MSSLKTLQAMKPDQVIAEIRKQIRRNFGDVIENKSNAFASNGYFYIVLPASSKFPPRCLRRKHLPAFFKELAAATE